MRIRIKYSVVLYYEITIEALSQLLLEFINNNDLLEYPFYRGSGFIPDIRIALSGYEILVI